MITVSPFLYSMKKLAQKSNEFAQAAEEQHKYGRVITLSEGLQALADVLEKDKKGFLEMEISAIFPVQSLLKLKNAEKFEEVALDNQILTLVFRTESNIEQAVKYFETQKDLDQKSDFMKPIRRHLQEKVEKMGNNAEQKIKSHNRFVLGSLFSCFIASFSTLWGLKSFFDKESNKLLCFSAVASGGLGLYQGVSGFKKHAVKCAEANKNMKKYNNWSNSLDGRTIIDK